MKKIDNKKELLKALKILKEAVEYYGGQRVGARGPLEHKKNYLVSKLSPEEKKEAIERFKAKYARSPANKAELEEFLDVEKIEAMQKERGDYMSDEEYLQKPIDRDRGAEQNDVKGRITKYHPAGDIDGSYITAKPRGTANGRILKKQEKIYESLKTLKEAVDATKFVSEQEIKEYWGFLSKQDKIRAKKEALRKGIGIKQFISQLVYAEKMKERGISPEDGDYEEEMEMRGFQKNPPESLGMKNVGSKGDLYESKKIHKAFKILQEALGGDNINKLKERAFLETNQPREN